MTVINFARMYSDAPILPSCGIYILQLVRFARCFTSVYDFHSKIFIERSLDVVLGTFSYFTTLYIPFLERCTLTNEWKGII